MLPAFNNGRVASRSSTHVIMVPGNHLLILRHEILLEQNYILNQVIENPSLEIPHNAGIGILALGSLSYFMYYNKGLRMHVSMFL